MSTQILDDTACELGEGPTYDPVQNKAWWFDILGQKLFEHDLDGGMTSIHELPAMSSMLGVIDEDRQLIAAENGLYLREASSNRFTLHHPLEADDPSTRSNDGRVHPSGAIWIGTMGKNCEPGAGAIYWFFKGELRKLFPGITIPNATCFSPDGATAYFTDTKIGRLMTVPVDPASGLPAGEPRVLFDHSGGQGGLDGAVVDEEGAIWVSLWGASGVMALSPQGDVLRSLPVPTRQPTCPAFIGPDLDRLIVTSAWEGMDATARHADADAGKTFILDIPVRGRAEPRVVL